jgi:hypothetical protein
VGPVARGIIEDSLPLLPPRAKSVRLGMSLNLQRAQRLSAGELARPKFLEAAFDAANGLRLPAPRIGGGVSKGRNVSDSIYSLCSAESAGSPWLGPIDYFLALLFTSNLD